MKKKVKDNITDIDVLEAQEEFNFEYAPEDPDNLVKRILEIESKLDEEDRKMYDRIREEITYNLKRLKLPTGHVNEMVIAYNILSIWQNLIQFVPEELIDDEFGKFMTRIELTVSSAYLSGLKQKVN